MCSFDFVDASGEIRVVAFRDECTRFHPIIEVDKVYSILSLFHKFSFCQIYDLLGVRVKTVDKRYNNLRHMYELNLTPGSVVRLVDDPAVNDTIPDMHYDFIPLRDVSKHSNESFIGKFIRSSRSFFLKIILRLKM